MATTIEICMEDDGTFSLETGEKEETPEEEGAEGGDKQTFKSVDEVLSAAKQLIEAGSMAPPPIEQEGAPAQEEAIDPAMAQQDEEAAMQQGFKDERQRQLGVE